jgi:hypothetical protein
MPPGATAYPGPSCRGSPDRATDTLWETRTTVLRLLLDLPIGVDIQVADFVAAVAQRLALPTEQWLSSAVTAAFLDPLVSRAWCSSPGSTAACSSPRSATCSPCPDHDSVPH